MLREKSSKSYSAEELHTTLQNGKIGNAHWYNSGKSVKGVTSHSFIGFEAQDTGNLVHTIPCTKNHIKSLWLGKSTPNWQTVSVILLHGQDAPIKSPSK